MALEAVVFPQEHFACSTAKMAVTMHAPSFGCGIDIGEFEEKGGVVLQEEPGAMMHGAGAGAGATASWNAACSSIASSAVEEHWDEKEACLRRPVSPPPVVPATPAAASGRGKGAAAAARRNKRRRPKAAKNTEETENQRRNHIAVERNRRRQMNEYLAVLRNAMPPSYAQRGDQASIVAGAINFVKELEQLLQSLEAQKRRARCSQVPGPPPPPPPPFAGFFTFPQYSTAAGAGGNVDVESGSCGVRRGVADVEVAVAESHANVKVLAPRRPKQLLRMVVALQCLGLTVVHLTATATADHLVFYSFSLKMEDECRLSSVDEIAAAVHQMVAKTTEDRVS